MDTIINKYYDGFEGEPEIQFISKISDSNNVVLRIWVGYFDKIMDAINPTPMGWSSLAYYYHMHEGWYEESPWEILDINDAIEQFKEIESNFFDSKTREVYKEICELLSRAQISNKSIWIGYE